MNRAIVLALTGRPPGTYPALSSLDAYSQAVSRAANWRDFYAREFDMEEGEIDRAGEMWSEYQFRDDTEVPVFEGIAEVLAALDDLPHGIVSQNGRGVIASVLELHRLAHHFGTVVGYEEVHLGRQKPAPDGLLRCLETLTRCAPGTVFYVGDHETDAVCAARASEALAARQVAVDVVSIAAFFLSEPEGSWEVQPDHVARQPMDIVEIVRGYARGA